MSYNLIFIDESESMQRAVAAIFLDNPEFNLALVNEPSSIYKAAKNFNPDIIVLGYNTIDTGLKKSITEIKTSREFSNIPLILLVPSDLSDNERETLIKLNSDGFIYRPFDKDAFISKIKRTLNGGNTDSNTSENTANTGNAEEKIYDIASFENKRTNENAYYQEHSGPESSELSQAFENLFKDDAIFKEFQNLNKKEGSGTAGYIIEDETAAQSAKIPDAELIAGLNEESAVPPASYTEAVEPKEQPAPPAETTEPEPIAAAMPEEIFGPAEPPEPGGSTPGIFESNSLSEPVKSAGIFELNTPDEEQPREHIEHNKDEGAPAFNEPFAGFNIALSGNTEEIGEPEAYKLNTDISTKKSEGELNLKILDEQNLVKLEDYLKNAIEKTIDEIKPQIIETIKTGLPEIIERLVKEEIEKIKQQ